ncbi:FusB/FusC family EF-G-binding protein [Paenibacillus planticolens]|uniref:Elongation factor G-binding protein n=1 Tax=Paenibacillus planticolens TaxID=2654976 RepID=A0ABX1ZMJ0_9BACL|nr:FusB/FusC family EF-G-binding protein [Paenibacillus planticolens]NOV00898.1 elongation factor G-binding protein [Paenibacillus planticolens]
MVKPFIRNHQYNLIKKQVNLLQQTANSVSDPKVVESVRFSAQSKVVEAFPEITEDHKQSLEKIAALRTSEEFQHYLHALKPYMVEISQVTGKQLSKLFPKIKKLKAPDFTTTDYRYVTYLGWVDIATNKMFIVYHLNGQWVGIEGRYTPSNKGVCFLCNRHEEVALFTAVTKWKPANASPDYYKAIGNYMCVDSAVCNKNITDVTALELFAQKVLGNRES